MSLLGARALQAGTLKDEVPLVLTYPWYITLQGGGNMPGPFMPGMGGPGMGGPGMGMGMANMGMGGPMGPPMPFMPPGMGMQGEHPLTSACYTLPCMRWQGE